jgi:hypothetical protein
MALKLVLRLAQESGVTHIQICFDSLPIIQWMCKEITLMNFTLQPLFNDVHTLLLAFSDVSFSRIYKERNMMVDGLSKVGLEFDCGI